MSLIPVENHAELFRDSKTGAIVNKSTSDFELYNRTRNKILSPSNIIVIDKNKLIKNAIAIACSAQLSAPDLSSLPMNLAIEDVTPVPNPIVKPNARKKSGILNAIPVIASPPN